MIQTAIKFTLKPSAAMVEQLTAHCGARRFAFNWCRANRDKAREAKKIHPAAHVPWSGFDHINAFNRFKHSAEAGVTPQGRIGLAWRDTVCQQVFEEGCKDFGTALARWKENFLERRKHQTKRIVGYPTFKKRLATKPTFRLRNLRKKPCILVEASALKLPWLGRIAVRESTRKIRRLLRQSGEGQPTAHVQFATISYSDGYWRVSLNLEITPAVAAAAARANLARAARLNAPAIGCDLGINNLVTLSDAVGSFSAEVLPPHQVQANQAAIRRAQRAVSLKRHASEQRRAQSGQKYRTRSRSELAARRTLQRRHARVRNIRHHAMHALTSGLAKSHGVIGIENLHVVGMMQNHCLAGAIGRQAWGEFKRQLLYKADRLGGMVVVADRFFPSTKRCSRCTQVKAAMPLSQRSFACDACGAFSDRDVNAAINLAWYAQQCITGAPQVVGCRSKTPEPGRVEAASGLPRARPPARSSRTARKSKGTEVMLNREHTPEAVKGRVDV